MAAATDGRPSAATRVVVTGMGALTPIGNDVPSFWDSLVAGRSGIGRIARSTHSRLDAQIAGEVSDFEPERRHAAQGDPAP